MIGYLFEIIAGWYGFWQFVFLYIVIATLATVIHAVVFRLPNRIIRHLNIQKAGWPPKHLDADGDVLRTHDD